MCLFYTCDPWFQSTKARTEDVCLYKKIQLCIKLKMYVEYYYKFMWGFSTGRPTSKNNASPLDSCK